MQRKGSHSFLSQSRSNVVEVCTAKNPLTGLKTLELECLVRIRRR